MIKNINDKYKIFIFSIAILNCFSLWMIILSWIIPLGLSFVNPETIEKLNITQDWLEYPITFFGFDWWQYLIISIILLLIPAILSLYGIESSEVKKAKEAKNNKKILSDKIR